ncbi:MAG: crotonase/enoyl-CoA hydratase family protein [Proteobacteria bacterium]|nr:crotonase/enoyl-CoA hydratase family protein [Pseudomonadota bacterium]
MASRSYLDIDIRGKVAVLTLSRPDRRNALNEATVEAIDAFFDKPPAEVRAVMLRAEGPHFCAGLDLQEHYELNRGPVEFMRMCQKWHRAFDKMQFGSIPVIAALKGAVVGGGLEIAAATHVRVAEPSTFFALPEGQRGVFTGGGATVRVARIMTPARMIDMMIAARTYDAKRGYDVGLAHELVGEGEAEARALQIAQNAAEHYDITNFGILTGISRINDMSVTDGLFAESLLAGMVMTNPDLRPSLEKFFAKQAPRLEPNENSGK